jgi:thioredoxin-related protein
VNGCPFLILGVLSGVSHLQAGLPWITNFADAKAMASVVQERMILEFTDSDGCAACKRLETEVLSSREFADYAGDCIAVRLDYPEKRKLSPELRKQNAALKEHYEVEAFPTVIVADAFGHEIRRAVGYRAGSGPEAYLVALTGEIYPRTHY